MAANPQTIFLGTWKSFKQFKRTGDIVLHSHQTYEELQFTDDGLVSITDHKNGRVKTLVSRGAWKVNLQNKKHFMKITYLDQPLEVITVNHTVLVLGDPNTQEKTFFSRECFWEEHLNSNHTITM